VRLLVLIYISCSSLLGVEPMRTWNNAKGESMEASFVRFKKDKIEIKRNDGRTFILSPDTFSAEDQKYLSEVRKRTDSSGELWSEDRATYHLTKSKWMDAPSGTRTYNLFEFKREKVDLNKDGKLDGSVVWKRVNRGSLRKRGHAMAWEVSSQGSLIIRTYDGNGVLYEGELNYNFEKGSFERVKGYGGVNFLIPVQGQ
jgi:hypothetical protein